MDHVMVLMQVLTVMAYVQQEKQAQTVMVLVPLAMQDRRPNTTNA